MSRSASRAIALVCSEAIRPNMAGIAIRYAEMARLMASRGHEVRLLSPAADRPDMPPGVSLLDWGQRGLTEQLRGCSAVIAQGQLANDVSLQVQDLPLAIDLYDPWLIENLHYAESLGLDPYRNDHASWLLQARRGDLFLCSSPEQRLFLLGFLTAVGRVQPHSMLGDPAFQRLVRLVPFGLPEEVPSYRPLLDSNRSLERPRLLFGGIYDWYDPMPVVQAVADAQEERQLIVVRNPNTDTPQERFAAVERWARRRGVWGERILAIDWVDYGRRYDLLRDVDLLISTHPQSLETDLSMRTRFLDALLVGCPIVTSRGGRIADLLTKYDAGWVLPRDEPREIADTITKALDGDPTEAAQRVERGRQLASSFSWQSSLQPILEFCEAPWRDPSRTAFTADLTTHAPADRLSFRVRRKLRAVLARG